MDRSQRAFPARRSAIDKPAVLAMLQDRPVVWLPWSVWSDPGPPHRGAVAGLEAWGERPDDGLCLCGHPPFAAQPTSEEQP